MSLRPHALACAAAHAVRPLQTEDADVLDRGDCEVEGVSATVWAPAHEHEGFDAGSVKLPPMAELFGAKGESAWWNLALRATLVPSSSTARRPAAPATASRAS